MTYKRLVAVCCVLMSVICTVAYAQMCLHPNMEKIGEITKYRKDIDGHFVDVVTKYYCDDCEQIATSTSSSFEGHNYMNTGNEHIPQTETHVTFYQCMNCNYTTQKTFYCSGNPCYISLNWFIDEDVVE